MDALKTAMAKVGRQIDEVDAEIDTAVATERDEEVLPTVQEEAAAQNKEGAAASGGVVQPQSLRQAVFGDKL